MLEPTIEISSIMSNFRLDNLPLRVLSLSWLSAWDKLYLAVPSRKAEWRVMPLILNAATPVEAVGNAITSSGSNLSPASLRNLMVSEWIYHMGFAYSTRTTKKHTIGFNGSTLL